MPADYEAVQKLGDRSSERDRRTLICPAGFRRWLCGDMDEVEAADTGMTLLTSRWRKALAVAVAALGLSATAAWIAAPTRGTHRFSPAASRASVPLPSVIVVDEHDAKVPFDHPLRIVVRDGRLSAVSVTDDRGINVGGAQADGNSWTTATALIPLARYTAELSIADATNAVVTQTVTVQATDTTRHLEAVVSPGDGDVVGVGMPVSVRFNADVPVAARGEVVSRLSIDTTPTIEGAWHWIGAREVHWRPQTYWASGTKVHVHTDLSRLDAGGGLWGGGHRNSAFAIGDARVSTADVAAHTFTVTANGQTVKVLNMSAGRDAYPTKNGVHIALEKAQVVTMDSQTVGIPRNSPDGYFEKVYWDVRISNGGAFVHAAPWSVNDQGHRNVSHGCVNLSTADAQWFYGFSQRGDIVNVINSPARPDLSDPGTADWNIPWSAWIS